MHVGDCEQREEEEEPDYKAMTLSELLAAVGGDDEEQERKPKQKRGIAGVCFLMFIAHFMGRVARESSEAGTDCESFRLR